MCPNSILQHNGLENLVVSWSAFTTAKFKSTKILTCIYHRVSRLYKQGWPEHSHMCNTKQNAQKLSPNKILSSLTYIRTFDFHLIYFQDITRISYECQADGVKEAIFFCYLRHKIKGCLTRHRLNLSPWFVHKLTRRTSL